MKLLSRTIAALFMLMCLLTGGIVEAASAETIVNETELARVKRLAIIYPDYFKTLEKEPTINEFMTAIFDASKVAKDTYVISYEDMATRIKSDTGIDIRVLPKMDARKIFKEHVYKYADGYVMVTLANNARINMFCDVYAVNSNELLYTLRIESGKRDEDKNVKNYKTIAEEFYRTFDAAVKSAEKKKNKN
ncbi:MAG: hypothetical protein IJ728_11055 [Selenomonadaceae bacterium]|nr:hypothetical protein [Selenomonadaceae bacterium]